MILWSIIVNKHLEQPQFILYKSEVYTAVKIHIATFQITIPSTIQIMSWDKITQELEGSITSPSLTYTHKQEGNTKHISKS